MSLAREFALDWAIKEAEKQGKTTIKQALEEMLSEAEEQIEGVFEEPNCSHCQDTGEYEGDTCPHCKPNKEEMDGERAMDVAKGN
jgi:DnaJ-class molecular chaperone